MRTLSSWLLAGTIGLAVFCPLAYAFDIPTNDGFVTDTTGKLTPEEKQDITQRLEAYRTQTSNEIAILMVNTLNGEDPADVATQVGRKWGVGSQKNNGILLLISYEERKIFIATGYGLEGAVPDIVAKGIVETDMAPLFRQGKYYEGILAGIDALQKHIGGEYTADRYAQTASPNVSAFSLFFLFVVLNLAVSVLRRSKSWWLGGVFGGVFGIILAIFVGWWISIPILIVIGLIVDFFVSKLPPPKNNRRGRWGGPWGGFGGGGMGGGGGGGFGGGSFGGGGGGGSW